MRWMKNVLIKNYRSPVEAFVKMAISFAHSTAIPGILKPGAKQGDMKIIFACTLWRNGKTDCLLELKGNGRVGFEKLF